MNQATIPSRAGDRAVSFLQMFPPNERRQIVRMFWRSLAEERTADGLLSRVLMMAWDRLATPNVYNGLAAAKRCSDLLRERRSLALAFAEAILGEQQRSRP